MTTTPIAAGPLDVTVRFILVEDSLPDDWEECLIYVEYEGGEPGIFYGRRDGCKWIGAMAWDSCGDGAGGDCVATTEIHGTVIAWAPFPKPNA